MAEIIQKTDKKTIYREGKTLVKLFNDEYPKSDVLNEALNTARVEEGSDQSERGMGDHSGLCGRQDAAAADG